MYSFKMNIEDYKWFAERSFECNVYDDIERLERVRWFIFKMLDRRVKIRIRYTYSSNEWFALVYHDVSRDHDYFKGLSYEDMILGIKKRLKELGVEG